MAIRRVGRFPERTARDVSHDGFDFRFEDGEWVAVVKQPDYPVGRRRHSSPELTLEERMKRAVDNMYRDVATTTKAKAAAKAARLQQEAAEAAAIVMAAAWQKSFVSGLVVCLPLRR